jgi:hypothetical protein
LPDQLSERLPVTALTSFDECIIPAVTIHNYSSMV